MTEPTAIVLASLIPTVTQVITTIFHYYAERHTRRVAQNAVEKVAEVKEIVQNGHIQ